MNENFEKPPNAEKLTTIALKKATRDRLTAFGYKGETFEDILNRLMDLGEEHGEKARA